MQIDDIEKAAELMARKKITRLKTADLELEMSPLGFEMSEQGALANPIGAEHGNPTEEELLMWSTGLGPDMTNAPPGEAPDA